MARNSNKSDGDDGALNPRQVAFIAKVSAFPYPSNAQAIRALGIPQRTLSNWLLLPHFQAALTVAFADDARRVKEQTRRGIYALANASVESLDEAMKSDDIHARLKAAFKVIDTILPESRDGVGEAANVNLRITLNGQVIERGADPF